MHRPPRPGVQVETLALVRRVAHRSHGSLVGVMGMAVEDVEDAAGEIGVPVEAVEVFHGFAGGLVLAGAQRVAPVEDVQPADQCRET